MEVPLGFSSRNRSYALDPEIQLQNRFFEWDPVEGEGNTLLSRPGTTFETQLPGPGQSMFAQKGVFSENLFIASAGNVYYRNVPPSSVNTQITGAVDPNSTPRWAADVATGYTRVFVVDGTNLQYYGGKQYQSTLNVSGSITNDEITVDGVYYQFSVGAPGAGSGTVGSPYQVFVNGSNTAALINLQKAINGTGVAGTDYSAGLVANARIQCSSTTSSSALVRGIVAGPLTPIANVTVVSGGGGLSWSANPLAAGPDVLYGITMPNNVAVSDVAVLSHFVFIMQANSQVVWFLLPGTTVVNGLNFITAETQPDNLAGVLSTGDLIWLLGQKKIEPWYITGDVTTPVARVQGRPISRGVKQGTHCLINTLDKGNQIAFVGDDKQVYLLSEAPQVISTNAIAERVRKSIEAGG